MGTLECGMEDEEEGATDAAGGVGVFDLEDSEDPMDRTNGRDQ